MFFRQLNEMLRDDVRLRCLRISGLVCMRVYCYAIAFIHSLMRIESRHARSRWCFTLRIANQLHPAPSPSLFFHSSLRLTLFLIQCCCDKQRLLRLDKDLTDFHNERTYRLLFFKLRLLITRIEANRHFHSNN